MSCIGGGLALRLPVLILAGFFLIAVETDSLSRESESPNANQTVQVDCDFPGGNIILEKIDGDNVYLHQDLRDTEGDWFYWYFRVRGAAGRTLSFHFTGSDVIGVRGPAVSADAGRTWEWLGRKAVEARAFRYTFPVDSADVRFCLAIPYLEADLHRFLGRHSAEWNLKTDVLCRTKKDREVEMLRLGRLDGDPDHRVLLTARHHACEMMASYVLEGLMDEVLAQSDDGRWLRGHVELLVVPFMDKDGVEDGDQGKNRRPHDHNRDYAGRGIHPSVAALREYVPRWAAGRLRCAIDLHCPYIRGQHNEDIYFVGGPDERIWKRAQQFAGILEKTQTGPLVYSTRHNLPFGQAWNSNPNQATFGRWAAALPGIQFATTIEFPYANATYRTVTPESARLFGRDVARALRRYLEQSGR